MNKSEPIIEVRNLRKTYKTGKVTVDALRGVNLLVPAGEFLSIVGPSGSGKSTLFHIVGGLTPPSAGEVIVAGQDVSAVGDAGRTELRRRKVSFVFQKFNLLPNLTARDNIRTALYIAGLPTAPFSDDTKSILELLGIAGRLDHKPSEMSGGEQQRVAIARALATRPAILLADEPTGNLDTANSLAVLTLLRDLNRRLGQTILMITHNTEAAEYADRIVHMRDGRIVETSTPD
ncbi:MAG: putative transport system ATP-binding protein [Bryobacterales bacterium]|jgi:putative ABC transport system ATP-binding protein|nr:putative transport system ATP-binding protein [Bryobacterales bacterium]